MATKRSHDEAGLEIPKTMLVTGASSGVGAALVKHYVAQGWTVAALARSEDRLKAICAEAGSAALPIVCDVSDSVAAKAAVAEAASKLGSIGCLINNAAATPHQQCGCTGRHR